MKNNTLRNFALLLTVLFAFSSCASMKMGKKANPYVGSWEYVVEELPVDIDGTLVITEVEGALKGTLVNPMGEMDLDKLTIVDDELTAELDADGTLVEFEGKFTGSTYEGFLFAQGGEFVMKMTKQE
jgi:hypothetical protein